VNPDLATPADAMAQSLSEALPLRDIVLPERISWWPPAPGWWLLLLVLLVIAAVSIWLWRRHQQRQHIIRPAQQMLQQIERRFARHGDSRQLLQELSALLRQIALNRSPREQVAGLVGDRWLQWLDQGLDDKPFSTGIGRVFTDQAYRPIVEIDSTQLLNLCHRWLTTKSQVSN